MTEYVTAATMSQEGASAFSDQPSGGGDAGGPSPSFDLFGNPSPLTPPLGFNNRRIPQTDISETGIRTDEVNRGDLERWQLQYVWEYERAQGYDVGISLSLYPSGEFTAACTALGAKPQKNRKKRGRISSVDLSPLAKKVMKRGIQNHWRPFNRMFTFTFDPSISVLSDDGTVCHDWAHNEISRTLATVAKKYQRLYEKTENRQFQLSYIRVSEVQPNSGNIHFHVLMDRHVDIKYLVDVWGQSSNSVDVQKVTGMRALNYLFKYLKKGGHLIYGKRYAMSEHLYEELKPCKISITGRHARSVFLRYMNAHVQSLLSGKGYVGDWGFTIPPPSRAGVSSSSHREFIHGLAEALEQGGYPEMMDQLLFAHEKHPDLSTDSPF